MKINILETGTVADSMPADLVTELSRYGHEVLVRSDPINVDAAVLISLGPCLSRIAQLKRDKNKEFCRYDSFIWRANVNDMVYLKEAKLTLKQFGVTGILTNSPQLHTQLRDIDIPSLFLFDPVPLLWEDQGYNSDNRNGIVAVLRDRYYDRNWGILAHVVKTYSIALYLPEDFDHDQLPAVFRDNPQVVLAELENDPVKLMKIFQLASAVIAAPRVPDLHHESITWDEYAPYLCGAPVLLPSSRRLLPLSGKIVVGNNVANFDELLYRAVVAPAQLMTDRFAAARTMLHDARAMNTKYPGFTASSYAGAINEKFL